MNRIARAAKDKNIWRDKTETDVRGHKPENDPGSGLGAKSWILSAKVGYAEARFANRGRQC